MEPDNLTDTPSVDKRAAVIVTPGTDAGVQESGRTPSRTTSPIIEGQSTPPNIRSAIEHISEFEFDPEETRQEEEEIALMMFSPKTSTELPKLRTGKWPHGNARPNPLSIGMARKLLAAALAEVPCELEEAGVHGYAWMIETAEVWKQRKDTAPITPPVKPKKIRTYEVKARWEYNDKLQEYTLYHHLVQEGKAKIIEWFGKELFVDLFVDGLLPTTITPRELLTHLSSTYGLTIDYRKHMENVEAAFNEPYDPKKPVEAYFMRLQDAQADAALLNEPISKQRLMNKALRDFERHYEKDSYKAERKWNEKGEDERTWEAFKTYWKNEIHQWDTVSGRSTQQAHQAVDLTKLQQTVEGLQAETRTLQEDNNVLSQQLQFQQAYQASQANNNGQDDISVLTSLIEGMINKSDSSSGKATRTDTDTDTRSTQDLLRAARERDPRVYASENNGKGKRFGCYCFNCGVNTTHWTRRCYEMSEIDRKKYRQAGFNNQMGGSTKFLDRKGKYQADYAFDSL